MHVPFSSIKDFTAGIAEQLAKVPPTLRNFAAAVVCEHEKARATWWDDEGLKHMLKQEAMTKGFIKTITAMVQANRLLVMKYIGGERDWKQERLEAKKQKQENEKNKADHGEAVVLNKEQKRLKELVKEAVTRAVAVHTTDEEADAENLRAEARDANKIYRAEGPPGTGKTTVAMESVHDALESGAAVLFAYPTNRQAVRMRMKLPETVYVDTCHAAFGLDMPAGSPLPPIEQYALIVVDEFSQLQKHHFEQIVKLWDSTDNLPCLLLLGDKLQMGGYGPDGEALQEDLEVVASPKGLEDARIANSGRCPDAVEVASRDHNADYHQDGLL